MHKSACSGSGGVSILLKESFLADYHVDQVDDNHDGILAVQLRNKLCHTCLVFICVYIPPDTSRRGREEAESIFEHLTQLLFQFEESDHIFLYGDFNARVGDRLDFIECVTFSCSSCISGAMIHELT